METNKSNFRLNNIRLSCNVLKIAACIFMLIDHVGYGIVHRYMLVHAMDMLPDDYLKLNNIYEICSGIGRLAFPIFTFFLVEGFLRTRNVYKYAARLAVFAVVSELPFDMGLFGVTFKFDHQNIILTFLVALIMLIVIRYIENNVMGLSSFVVTFACICTVIAFGQLSVYLHTDYSWKCMMLAAVLYFTRSDSNLKLLCGAAASSWEKYAPASFVLLYFYDPSVKPRFKYAFYAFYPLHLTVIGLIGYFIIGY